ncbi:MAG: sulfurtransferase TusA family protein [Alphaproteobacteria bacterium]|nr:sulfurtransferase TusA family protein [Alphaproteobacteria bacterium]
MVSSDDANIPELDLRGLKCPLPALLARRALKAASKAADLCVLADDPLAYIDIPHMCMQEGFEVLSLEREGTIVTAFLRKPA